MGAREQFYERFNVTSGAVQESMRAELQPGVLGLQEGSSAYATVVVVRVCMGFIIAGLIEIAWAIESGKSR